MNFRSIRIYEEELEAILDFYKESIILAVSPSYDYKTKIGRYRVALLYKKYRKILSGEVIGIISANRTAIYGLVEGAKGIRKPLNIVIMTPSTYGFKKATRQRGANLDLWNQLFSILESKGCVEVVEIVVIGGGKSIAAICGWP